MAKPISDHALPKIIEVTFSFLNLHHHEKYQFIPSIHSWDTVNFRSPVTRLSTSVFDHAHPKIFDKLLIYEDLYKHAKTQAILLICSGDMADLTNPAIWLAENILGHISGTKIFPNMAFAQEHSK